MPGGPYNAGMRLGIAIVAGLALGAALGWWKLGHPGYETGPQKAARAQAAAAAAEAARPRLYRWRDARGVLQLTDKPPRGRKYQVVDVDAGANVNVIPMSPPPEPPR
jgi:hypothetical protein